MTVRVRFAPSPTGMFHVGSARVALQNWVYARQHDGVFVLRIEDTDASRNRPEWTEGILSALDWLGIERGRYEGPYFQSEYAEAAPGGGREAARLRSGVLLRLHPGGGAGHAPATSTAGTTASVVTAGWRPGRAGRCGSAPRTKGRPALST